MAHIDQPKWTFFGRLHFGPQGVLHPETFRQSNLAHTPTGTAVPLKNFNRENLKFGLKFSVWATITSGLMGVPSWNFIQSTCRRARVITRVQFLEGPPPKICEDEKTSKIRRAFWQLSTLIANISEMHRHVAHRKSIWSTSTPSKLSEKNYVKFGPRTKALYGLILTHPSGHFSGDYISALRGVLPLKFLHALEIDQDYLAHPQRGGVPPKKFNCKKLKFWPKIHRLSP